MNRNSKTARRINKIVFYVSLVFMLFIILFPFIIMLSTSLKGAKEAIQYPPTIIPKNITFEHYRDIFNPKIFSKIYTIGIDFLESLCYTVSVAGACAGFRYFGRAPGVRRIPRGIRNRYGVAH